ncbi:DUF3658 domain-containing protein [Brevibacillus choshinensis]|uniref:DUF3658 domain-containing protein n=1 Tax=Brevibacillus choshinensis TaxID=54911 RepID=UPI002E22204F|nr:DUF3658 domain-containing protein [Brevibacillus choshinensis]MED4752871.1 DUF3658 domain-containing protein [Brevibacillus choshinensis]
MRIWNGHNIQSVEEEYFDSFLLEIVEKLHNDRNNHDFMKAARVVGEALGNGNPYMNQEKAVVL